ncbi:MAG TPA: VCBS repeat-containing protein, partial [Planctomycetota bacterium]|nr:VCBS repeat-containing protein [Planctomycetota bacterium]
NDTPPSVGVVSIGFPGLPLRGRVPIVYEIVDPEEPLDPVGRGSATLSVTLVDAATGARQPATGIALLAAGGAIGGISRPVRTSAAAGVSRTAVFLWDTAADVGTTPAAGTSVTLAFTAVLASGERGPESSAFVVVQNPVDFDPQAPVILPSDKVRNFAEPWTAVRAIDLSGDGLPEIFILDAERAVARYLLASNRRKSFPGNNHLDYLVVPPDTVSADGTFVQPPLGHPVGLAFADFDGDGIVDLAVADADAGSISIYTNNARPSFKYLASLPLGATPTASPALADVNGDGIADLLVPASDSVTELLLGASGLAGETSIALGGGARALALADLTGDGRLDLVVAPDAPGTVGVVPGVDGGFDAAGPVDIACEGAGEGKVLAGDFTGSGLGDLLVLDRAAGSLLLGRGRAVPGLGGLPSRLEAALAFGHPGDFDALDLGGEGRRRDLAVTESLDNQVAIVANRGGGRFDVVARLPTGSFPVGVAAADLTGDGVDDLAIADGRSDTVTIYHGRAPARFDVAFTLPGAFQALVAAGDVDGDGVADLLVVSG